jgi:acetylornithine/N-succinyldiaminopimelate aminotransferase
VAREITSAAGALLVLDEVQTGMGRTGPWLAHQHPRLSSGAPDGVLVPDVVTLAKGLGGGIPIGAVVAFGGASSLLGPGDHGTTFGGNPVAAAAALATLHVIERDGLREHAAVLGRQLADGLRGCHAEVRDVRGEGLLLGVVLGSPVAVAVRERLLDRYRIIVNAAAPDVLRLAPPLVLTADQADALVEALPAALDDVLGTGQAGSSSGEHS